MYPRRLKPLEKQAFGLKVSAIIIITNHDKVIANYVINLLITNYDKVLLQIMTAFLLKTTTKFLQIANRYFKLRQNYYKLRQLLQTTTIYYKLRQNTCYKCSDHKETKASLITYKTNIKVKHKLLLSFYKKREQRQYAK